MKKILYIFIVATIFVFKKANGHTARGLLDSKPDDYLLIKDENIAKKYKNEKYEDYITIVGLNNFKITSLTLVSEATQLENILN